MIFAAASLADSLKEAARNFEKERGTEAREVFQNYGFLAPDTASTR
jgi:hypothetical protein